MGLSVLVAHDFNRVSCGVQMHANVLNATEGNTDDTTSADNFALTMLNAQRYRLIPVHMAIFLKFAIILDRNEEQWQDSINLTNGSQK